MYLAHIQILSMLGPYYVVANNTPSARYFLPNGQW